MPGIHKRSRVNRGCDVKVWLGLPSDRGGDEGFYAKEEAEVYDVMTRSKVSHSTGRRIPDPRKRVTVADRHRTGGEEVRAKGEPGR